MNPTTQSFARFVGGQIEIQDVREGHLYRGEIASITIENGHICFKFAWLARCVDPLAVQKEWINEEKLDHEASLIVCTFNDIGPSSTGGDNQVCISAGMGVEIFVLYPPNGSKLDPARVEGLRLTPA